MTTIDRTREHVPLSPHPELPFGERIERLGRFFSGRLGFHAVRLDDGEQVGRHADDAFPTASVIKVGLCCAVLDLVAGGQADLGEIVRLPPRRERVAGGGILKQLELDRLSLRDAIELTITLSDNVATNALLERCDAERTNAYLAGLGLARTRILGPVDFACITHDLAGGIGVSTPREQTTLLTALARDEILTPTLCAYLRGVLERQHYLDQLPRWLGWNTYAQYHARPTELTVGNKTGELDGIRADAGLVRRRGRGTLAVAIFTDGAKDLRETVDVEGALAVAECSAAIAAHLLGLDA
ncbi:MAG: class A beta-lactamase-related serine hydrolase [Actinomycetota bacterium]|nr:class A beta-lactamase-related serine hydrolase [Actinomycetota bacterium]